VGGAGRTPGCGAGGLEDVDVVVAGVEAGIVRVGVGLLEESAVVVEGVIPSGFMGAFLWMGIGGMVAWWCFDWCEDGSRCVMMGSAAGLRVVWEKVKK
jgi:hypothetical protein